MTSCRVVAGSTSIKSPPLTAAFGPVVSFWFSRPTPMSADGDLPFPCIRQEDAKSGLADKPRRASKQGLTGDVGEVDGEVVHRDLHRRPPVHRSNVQRMSCAPLSLSRVRNAGSRQLDARVREHLVARPLLIVLHARTQPTHLEVQRQRL